MVMMLRTAQNTSADLKVVGVIESNELKATTLVLDNQASNNNTMQSQMFATSALIAGGYDTKGIRIHNSGNVDYKYNLTSKLHFQDNLLCQELNVNIWKDESLVFRGKLKDLKVDFLSKAGEIDNYMFVVKLDSNKNEVKNQHCEFDFVFRTASGDHVGLWDERSINNVVDSGP